MFAPRKLPGRERDRDSPSNLLEFSGLRKAAETCRGAECLEAPCPSVQEVCHVFQLVDLKESSETGRRDDDRLIARPLPNCQYIGQTAILNLSTGI